MWMLWLWLPPPSWRTTVGGGAASKARAQGSYRRGWSLLSASATNAAQMGPSTVTMTRGSVHAVAVASSCIMFSMLVFIL